MREHTCDIEIRQVPLLCPVCYRGDGTEVYCLTVKMLMQEDSLDTLKKNFKDTLVRVDVECVRPAHQQSQFLFVFASKQFKEN